MGKHLTDEELAAEWARAAFVVGVHGPYIWGPRVAAMHRFLTTPHWDQGAGVALRY